MKLQPLHGRDDPNQDMDEMGYHGPVIEGVKALHVTYNTHHNLYFQSPEDAAEAQRVTKWTPWDENALEMEFLDGMLVIDGHYYGDWEIQENDF